MDISMFVLRVKSLQAGVQCASVSQSNLVMAVLNVFIVHSCDFFCLICKCVSKFTDGLCVCLYDMYVIHLIPCW